jgi:hypothetical protein
LRAGQPATFPVGAGVLATVVEEADVVVLLLQRAYLPLDELIQLAQVGDQVARDLKVHIRGYAGPVVQFGRYGPAADAVAVTRPAGRTAPGWGGG